MAEIPCEQCGHVEGSFGVALAIAQYDKRTTKQLEKAAAGDSKAVQGLLFSEEVIIDFNDANKTTFADIRKVVVLAKKLVRTADTK